MDEREFHSVKIGQKIRYEDNEINRREESADIIGKWATVVEKTSIGCFWVIVDGHRYRTVGHRSRFASPAQRIPSFSKPDWEL